MAQTHGQKSQIQSPRRIFLIGMPGSGKSTIARAVAREFGWTWIDTDACVERITRMTIPDVFSEFGEDEFRKREWECLRQAARTDEAVISCGGGVPCFFDAADLVLASGTVIYLHASPHVLLERLSTGIADRPLLLRKDTTPERILAQILSQREAFYNRAHHVIRTDGMSVDEVRNEVCSKFKV